MQLTGSSIAAEGARRLAVDPRHPADPKGTDMTTRMTAGLFLFAGVLFVIAGVLPAIRGGSVNIVFCVLGVVFAILSITFRTASSREGDKPDP